VNYRSPERADALAAAFVLGTLSRRARARFATLARRERVLAEAVRQWEHRLLPLAESLPGIEPPSRVWDAIAARIGARRIAGAAVRSVWASVGLWRAIALVGFVAAFALAAVLLVPIQRAEQSIVIVLAGPDARPALVATAERGGHYLTVKALTPLPIAADRALELWALPEQGNPRSLGLVSASGIARIALVAPADTALRSIPALAVSLEPAGGSPTGLPTGPVLYSGSVQRLF